MRVLLCGGTGDLGGRIAVRIAAEHVPFRVLLRSEQGAPRLRALGAEIATGDLTDRASLEAAVEDVDTVVTTANAIGRLLSGKKDLSIDTVDRVGNAHLVAAAEAAGVSRFVFVSFAGCGDDVASRAPLAAAKLQTERLLQASPMREVIVRPDKMHEVWLSAKTGIDPVKHRAVILGRGLVREAYVATDDVAEACVRLALHDDPPAMVEFGGPEHMTRRQVVDAFEAEFGHRFRRVRVPRVLLRLGARALRRAKPEVASVLGMALAADLTGSPWTDEPLLRLGITPRPATTYIRDLARETETGR